MSQIQIEFDNLEKSFIKLQEAAKLNKAMAVYPYARQCETFLAMSALVNNMQNLYLKEKRENNKYDVEIVKLIDYKTSSYAYDTFLLIEKMLETLYKVKKYDIMDKYGVELSKRLTGVYTNQNTKDNIQGMLQISARWFCGHNIQVFELDKNIKIKAFDKRRPLLETCIFYIDRMLGSQLGIKYDDEIEPNKIIFAVQQSGGKSLIANNYSQMVISLAAMYYGISGILRMSNNETNANGFSGQIKAMIENERFLQIYPEYNKYLDNATGKIKPFTNTAIEEWKLKDLHSSIRASHFARGREAAINSIRVFLALIIDDLSDGEPQSANDEEHKKQFKKYDTDMEGRSEFEDMPQFICGTMYNPYDVPNQIIERLEAKGILIDNPILPENCYKYFQYDYKAKKPYMTNKNGGLKYVRCSKDYKTIIIQIPALDENDESLAPKFRTTQYLREKKAGMDAYIWQLLFQSQRATREGKEFDYDKLLTYTELPKEDGIMSNFCRACCDPTRKKGKDFFALGAFKINYQTNKHYFVDCIFERNSMKDKQFRKNVSRFLIDNNVTELFIETNTGSEIATMIEEDLLKENYVCKVTEIYNTINKRTRILDEAPTIIREIIFPDNTITPPKSHKRTFMNNLTEWSSLVNVKNDDAPDNIAAYCFKWIDVLNKNRLAQIEYDSRTSNHNLWKII